MRAFCDFTGAVDDGGCGSEPLCVRHMIVKLGPTGARSRSTRRANLKPYLMRSEATDPRGGVFENVRGRDRQPSFAREEEVLWRMKTRWSL